MPEHIIITCTLCRERYDMDFEPSLDDTHLGPDGVPCTAEDDEWLIEVVGCGEGCRIHGQRNTT